MKLIDILRVLIVPFVRLLNVLFKGKKESQMIAASIENIAIQLDKHCQILEKMGHEIIIIKDNLQIVLEMHHNPNEVNALKKKLTDVINDTTADNKTANMLMMSVMYDCQRLFEKILYTDFKEFSKDSFYHELKTIAFSKNIPKNKEIEIIIKDYCSSVNDIAKEKTNGQRVSYFMDYTRALFKEIAKVLIKIQ